MRTEVRSIQDGGPIDVVEGGTFFCARRFRRVWCVVVVGSRDLLGEREKTSLECPLTRKYVRIVFFILNSSLSRSLYFFRATSS